MPSAAGPSLCDPPGVRCCHERYLLEFLLGTVSKTHPVKRELRLAFLAQRDEKSNVERNACYAQYRDGRECNHAFLRCAVVDVPLPNSLESMRHKGRIKGP
jgi:hypothetical protein